MTTSVSLADFLPVTELIVGSGNSGTKIIIVSPIGSIQSLIDLKINQKLRKKNGVLCIDHRPRILRYFSNDNRWNTLNDIEILLVAYSNADVKSRKSVYSIIKDALCKLKATYTDDILWKRDANNLISLCFRISNEL